MKEELHMFGNEYNVRSYVLAFSFAQVKLRYNGMG